MPVIELSKKQLNDIHTKTNKIVQMLHKDLQDSKSFKNINLKSVESSPSNKKLNKKLAFLITINVQAPVKKPDKQAKKLGHDVETSIHQLMESKKMKAVLKKDTYVIKVYSKDGKLLN
nr:DUF4030 domain-containing protein [Scopulibacillus daqui]